LITECREVDRRFRRLQETAPEAKSRHDGHVPRLSDSERLVYRNQVLAFWLSLELGVPAEEKRTALLASASMGRAEIIQLLIANDTDLEVRDRDGVTALMIAARAGHVDIVELLLDGGADVEAMDRDGESALQIAAKEGKLSIVQTLTEKGADTSALRGPPQEIMWKW
jgi:ankyrin repeat protein